VGFELPKERFSLPVVTFLEGGTWSAYPPTLGGVGDTPSEALFDTLYSIPLRLGWEARVARDSGEAFSRRSSAVVVVNPIEAVATHDVAAAAKYVSDGGTLILVDRVPHHHVTASATYLSEMGVSLDAHHHGESVELRPVGMEVLPDEGWGLKAWTKTVGRGRVLFILDSDRLSREGLGHNFSYPNAEEERRYRYFAHILTEHTDLGGQHRPRYSIIE
jgi:hypothetical protein